jgi:alkanesulfonate monooxygenase SsuD/methylene tetrahydromethanopterin reductase-like flavin-dependent oxidoreductase (luciferase family)
MIKRGQPERYANRTNLAQQMAARRILVGSPGSVAAQLGEYLERSGANYFLGCFTFGDLSLEHTLRSVELFATEVIPALTRRATSARGRPAAAL